MPFSARLAAILFLVAWFLCPQPGAAQAVREIGGGSFNVPRGVAVDGNGNLFVLDTGAQAVREVFAPGGYVTVRTIVPPASANLIYANAIAVDSQGNIFVSSLLADTVIEIVAAGGYTVVKPLAVATGNFSHPYTMAIDAADNLFVVDTGNGTVKELLAAGGYATVKPLAVSFTFPFALVMDGQGNLFVGDTGPSTGRIVEILAAGGYSQASPLPLPAGSVVAPRSLAIDGSGNLFSLETTTLAVSEFPAQGGYTTSKIVAGSGNFVDPSAIALDGQGNLFVTDADGNQVKEFLAAGGYASSAEIAPRQGNFLGPVELAVDGSGNVFVNDIVHRSVKEIVASGGYTTTVPIAGGFSSPEGLALDAAGNIFVADTDSNAVKEILAEGGYTTVNTLAAPLGGFNRPWGVAVDQSGNVFVSDDFTVWEILAAGGYVTVNALGSGFGPVAAIAVDGNGNVFVADGSANPIKEILAAGGYATVVPIAVANGKFVAPNGVSVDAAGNVYVADAAPAVWEILASDGYVTVQSVAPGQFFNPSWVATDRRGNVFVSDSGVKDSVSEFGANDVVQVVTEAAPLVAAVLPGSRSVEVGAPATIFATILNTGSTALSGCGVLPQPNSFPAITLQYQATDASTNQVTGAVDTPVSIAANGSQTFVLTIVDDFRFVTGLALDYAPVFECDGVGPAPVTPGVNTVDLLFSFTPTADIIALAATPSGNGVVTVPFSKGGEGAFALATINEGASATITVATDAGSANLPIAVTLCQTDPATAQCLATPSASVSLTIASGATPTFSLFVSATAAVTLAPATSRIFVQFLDADGNLHGSTSVAVEAD